MTSSAINLNNSDVHSHDEHHHDTQGTKVLGFWIYLMSDCLIFASLFATYAVLMVGTAGGPGPKDIFDLNLVLAETGLLLLSSITFGFAMLAMKVGNSNGIKFWLVVTFLLGAGFLAIELYEFNHLIHNGWGPDRSAFLSAFFALVGTHGIHVTAGLIWIIIMLIQISRRGVTETNSTRLMCLSLFWHFLDVIWIGVFTFVYLMGVI
ncbi:cytochrome o ubiquinol oxidase subunit III [Thorsellia anophelis]|uniref:Cytochrome bo(3) ubiquinol oxidase subunit 3 n=1 Tax=Thorsellia anophelis DSM 18579 TaxID=1123402 RepID=A0A1I0DEI4_9GAMM|nr:cytochrome o ubiquinol oxidase subunit III [Thorsellia anophelis]SET30542.1 cytochrome o ubiquinol oxidase subunit 3 [Thorsellia anophelis DSM 18579]